MNCTCPYDAFSLLCEAHGPQVKAHPNIQFAHQLSELIEEYIASSIVHHEVLPISAETHSFEGFARWLKEYK